MAKIDWDKDKRRRMTQGGRFSGEADGDGAWVSPRDSGFDQAPAEVPYTGGKREPEVVRSEWVVVDKRRSRLARSKGNAFRKRMKRQGRVKCPYCASYLKKNRLEFHLYKVHGVDLDGEPRTSSRTIRRPRSTPATTTTATTHDHSAENPGAEVSSDEYIDCPKDGCTTRVKRKNLERHIKWMHETSAAARARKLAAKKARKSDRKIRRAKTLVEVS